MDDVPIQGADVNQFLKAVLRDLAPTGKLRAAINYGNPVLAQKDVATGQPKGVSVDLALELAWRLDMPIELVTFRRGGQGLRGDPLRRLGRRLPRNRSGAGRGDLVYGTLRGD